MALSGATAAVSAAAGLGMAVSTADPASNSIYNVVGEPYAKAVAILRAQGIPTSFGGSVGSDVPQSRCIVSSQKVLGTGKMLLMLDCTAEAQPEAPAPTSAARTPGAPSGDGGGRPTAGAPGVVTVVPTPVG
ncbi:MAG: hypothetical protein KDB56_03890 [Mycobacterium sp.]|nr:hypothetical protein [Mycobacterium sp.]